MNNKKYKMYESYKKYAVQADSVEDFCNRYYKPSAFHDRTGSAWDYGDGESYQEACIKSHKKHIERDGFTTITRHDSKTGEVVAYYPNEQ